MIRSWRGEAARLAFQGQTPRGFSPEVARAARRRLVRLDDAESLEALRSIPGNRLHRLSGDRAGQWSIRVNDQFRLCFVWRHEGAEDVELLDYH